MPKVSVIVPVYNTEKYLPKCLDSLTAQTLKDIEIICINDCSPDNSLAILQKYAAGDDRIKVIDFKENKGAAIARNTGIDAATGDYIGFVDSDDYVDLDFYENLYKKAQESNADVVKGSDMKLCYEDGKVKIDEQNDGIKKNKINFWCQYTTAIYKKDFIVKNKIDFPVGLLVGEDPVFTIKAAVLANKIAVIDNAQYYYVRHEGSLNSDIWDNAKIESYIKYVELITDFIIKQNLSTSDHQRFFGWLINNIYKTRECKTVYNRKMRHSLTKLYEETIKKSTRFPIKLLFDTAVFSLTEHNEGSKRGIYFVSCNLVQKFLNDPRFDVTLYCEKNIRVKYLKTFPMFKNAKFAFPVFQLGDGGGNRVIRNTAFNAYDYDAYFNSEFRCFPFSGGKPVNFYVLHDVIPMLKSDWIDEGFREYFWHFYNKFDSEVYTFCVSKSCQQGFLRFFDKLDAHKSGIAYNSTAQNFKSMRGKTVELQNVLKKYGIDYHDQKYIFYLGAANDKRKNLICTAECFMKFLEKYQIDDLYFYIGGSGKDVFLANLKANLGSLYEKYKDHIVPLGFVDEEDVNILYSNSLFFSFLSEYEGFGMPPLEAMQAGTPVICADNSSLPEVVGDAAILVNAEDEDKIIEAFKILYFDEDKRNELIQKGFKQAEKFSWDKTYKIISDRIIEVLKGDG